LSDTETENIRVRLYSFSERLYDIMHAPSASKQINIPSRDPENAQIIADIILMPAKNSQSDLLLKKLM